MSPPAEKARLPAPVMTMHPTSSSALIRATASRSSAFSCAFIALSCSGRFRVRIATPSVFSTRTTWSAIALLRRRRRRRVESSTPCSEPASRGSALGGRVLRDLLLQPFAQCAVGFGANHAVELRPVARDEADPLDDDVVDAPLALEEVHAVVKGDLDALPGHHLRAHDRPAAALAGFAEEQDLVVTDGLHLRQVCVLQEIPEERDELRLLVALQGRPVTSERPPGDLVEVEHLANDLTDLPQAIRVDRGAVGTAALDDVHETVHRRFDRVARSYDRRGRRGLGY